MQKLENYLNWILKKKYTPSISILVSYKDNIIYKNTFGYSNVIDKTKADNNTIYDLASLTKSLVTAPLILYLFQRKELKLDDNINKFFPEYKFDFTILNLLTHSSGLPAWFPFYLFNTDYEKVFYKIEQEKKAGKRVVYSCVGYILLALIINKISNNFIDLYNSLYIEKLGLKNTYLRVPDNKKKLCAATEKGNSYEKGVIRKNYPELLSKIEWRDYLIQGETHDNNSFYFGGSAGNAGMFSNIDDLNFLLKEFTRDGASILKPEIIDLFYKNFTSKKLSHRSIGFKLNSSLITSGGKYLSKKSIGHNGFTGTSIWIDPLKNLKIILLTNRIHPVYKNLNFNRVRRHIHKLIVKELI